MSWNTPWIGSLLVQGQSGQHIKLLDSKGYTVRPPSQNKTKQNKRGVSNLLKVIWLTSMTPAWLFKSKDSCYYTSLHVFLPMAKEQLPRKQHFEGCIFDFWDMISWPTNCKTTFNLPKREQCLSLLPCTTFKNYFPAVLFPRDLLSAFAVQEVCISICFFSIKFRADATFFSLTLHS